MPLIRCEATDNAAAVLWRLRYPAQLVWRCLRSVDSLPQWLGSLQAQGHMASPGVVVDHFEGVPASIRVSEVQPHRMLVAWAFAGEEPSPISVSLCAAPTNPQWSTLRLHHQCGAAGGAYLALWITHLAYFEAQMAHHPLPQPAFGSLYSTVAQCLTTDEVPN